ncbi:MAG: hypothetical protein ACYDCK_06620 [Thermoplasmatota archaeon]
MAARILIGRQVDVGPARETFTLPTVTNTEPAWRNYLFGHKTEQIADTVPGSVILVKAHPGPTAHRARYFSRKIRSIGRYILPR